MAFLLLAAFCRFTVHPANQRGNSNMSDACPLSRVPYRVDSLLREKRWAHGLYLGLSKGLAFSTGKDVVGECFGTNAPYYRSGTSHLCWWITRIGSYLSV